MHRPAKPVHAAYDARSHSTGRRDRSMHRPAKPVHAAYDARSHSTGQRTGACTSRPDYCMTRTMHDPLPPAGASPPEVPLPTPVTLNPARTLAMDSN